MNKEISLCFILKNRVCHCSGLVKLDLLKELHLCKWGSDFSRSQKNGRNSQKLLFETENEILNGKSTSPFLQQKKNHFMRDKKPAICSSLLILLLKQHQSDNSKLLTPNSQQYLPKCTAIYVFAVPFFVCNAYVHRIFVFSCVQSLRQNRMSISLPSWNGIPDLLKQKQKNLKQKITVPMYM